MIVDEPRCIAAFVSEVKELVSDGLVLREALQVLVYRGQGR